MRTFDNRVNMQFVTLTVSLTSKLILNEAAEHL